MKTVPLKKVISASRRLDLLAFFPERLDDFLTRRCPPEKVHSIVLWSKNPVNLLEHRTLRNTLRRYDQLFLHWTLTGMGGTRLEPNICDVSVSLGMLPSIIRSVGSPLRVRIRFDPIVHLKMPDGVPYSNLEQFVRIAEAAEKAGIRELIVSWMENYPKVESRLRRHQIVPEPVSEEKWRGESEWLGREARRIGVRISGCSVAGMPVSMCIDGKLLMKLHPGRETAAIQKAQGQRMRCGCTQSWDIGWYLPCPGGCLYCYARPAEPYRPDGGKPE